MQIALIRIRRQNMFKKFPSHNLIPIRYFCIRTASLPFWATAPCLSHGEISAELDVKMVIYGLALNSCSNDQVQCNTVDCHEQRCVGRRVCHLLYHKIFPEMGVIGNRKVEMGRWSREWWFPFHIEVEEELWCPGLVKNYGSTNSNWCRSFIFLRGNNAWQWRMVEDETFPDANPREIMTLWAYFRGVMGGDHRSMFLRAAWADFGNFSYCSSLFPFQALGLGLTCSALSYKSML